MEIPKLKKRNEKGKITTYPSKKAEDLYHIGKENGHDTPRLVRETIEKALLENEEKLKKLA